MTQHYRRHMFYRRGMYGGGLVSLARAVAKVRRDTADDLGWTDAHSLPGEAILDAIRENA